MPPHRYTTNTTTTITLIRGRGQCSNENVLILCLQVTLAAVSASGVKVLAHEWDRRVSAHSLDRYRPPCVTANHNVVL
jgi:hypothetical protein